MTTYYMISRNSSTIGYWDECKAKTLIGAKREATKEYGDGYNDSVLIVSVGDNVTEQRQIMATKRITESRWNDEE